MIITLVILALIVVFVLFGYNRLVALRQAWKQAFADIDVQLKQRHDLMPNLVETVKGYAAHESGVFTGHDGARLGDARDRRGRKSVPRKARCRARSAICWRWRKIIRS
jgi:hypothetical protein